MRSSIFPFVGKVTPKTLILSSHFRTSWKIVGVNFHSKSSQLCQQWIKLFLNDISSCVLNTGWSTEFFKVSRGVRQGYSNAPYLFLLWLFQSQLIILCILFFCKIYNFKKTSDVVSYISALHKSTTTLTILFWTPFLIVKNRRTCLFLRNKA
jgi:hypothetical protein